MNDNIIEWAKALNSLSVEYILSNLVPLNWRYEPPNRCHIRVSGSVVFHLDGHVFRLRPTFGLMALVWDEDEALYDLVDLSNFKEAIRVMTL